MTHIFFYRFHTENQHPRLTRNPRKVRADRRKKEKITVLIVATMFVTQTACNAARAAHALRWDQFGHL